jgi:hypothetical protein
MPVGLGWGSAAFLHTQFFRSLSLALRAHAVNLELSPAYEEEATSLLREAGLEERAEWRLHDIVVDPEGVDAADVQPAAVPRPLGRRPDEHHHARFWGGADRATQGSTLVAHTEAAGRGAAQAGGCASLRQAISQKASS